MRSVAASTAVWNNQPVPATAPSPSSEPAGALPGWVALLTSEGQQRLAAVEAGIARGESLTQANTRLRSEGLAPEDIAATLTQIELRMKARGKFGDSATRLLFTPAGLEQATRAPVAALHARRFADAGCRHVADLGCGIGAESLALQAEGIDAHAVELDPFTAAIAQHNLGTPVTVADAEGVALDRLGDGAAVDGVFLDPARRTSGHRDTRRLSSPDDYSPSLTYAFGLTARFPTGIKLGPGFDRELIPEQAEAQWVSVGGQVVETGLWFGAVARPGVRRAAMILRELPDGTTTSAELTAAADSTDAETRPLGNYVYEPDGAVIRARLIGLLAEQLSHEGARAGMMSDGIAYLTADRHIKTPFATAFRVREELPVNEKQLRRALKERGIGRLEIKKRGVPVEPAELRKRLKLQGAGSATLILTRSEGRHIALLADRLET